MSFLYYLAFLKFFISYCFELINISPYEFKIVKFSPQKTYQIFKYNHIIFPKVNASKLSVRAIGKTKHKEYKFYLYSEVKNITQENGEFINSREKGFSNDYIIFLNIQSNEYYIVIQYTDNYDLEETFYFFSCDSIYEVKNSFYNDYLLLENANHQNYIFSISPNHKRYVKFGANSWANGRGYGGESLLTVTDEDSNITIYRIEKDDYNDLVMLEQNHTYYFNFSLTYTYRTNLYSLYLLQLNYSNLIYVEKDKKEFDFFPVIKELNILLDSSSTKKNYKLYFEYNKEWRDKEFSAVGYTTDDINIINSNLTYNLNNQNNYQNYISSFDFIYNLNNNSNEDSSYNSNKISSDNSRNDSSYKNLEVIPLTVEMEDCSIDDLICKGYIIKDNINLKMVILKIPKGSKENPYIKFRYGKEEYIPPSHILFSSLIGLALALPNIIMYILRKVRNKMAASAFTLFMNIILNFSYGNLIGYLVKLGGKSSKILGFSLLFLYISICLIILYWQHECECKCSYFEVIYNLCRKIEDSKSLQEILSYNRKLHPIIKIGCYAQHKESREVWEEYEEYQVEIYREKTTYYTDGTHKTKKYFDHYETRERYIKTHYSKWKRVDEGGGHFYHAPGSPNNIYKKSTETKTVETWREELEYKYRSWQDDTENLSDIKYCSIVEAFFSYQMNFDQTSLNILSKMKSELYNEGLTYDTDVHTYEKFDVPDFNYMHTCSLNDFEYQRIKNKYGNCFGYTIWITSFVLGYSSIFDAYSKYEKGKEKIIITKSISNDNDKRAPYLTNEINPPSISISFVHTKLQVKALEKKLKEGKIDSSDFDIPLIKVK